jgi:hypothetical protein
MENPLPPNPPSLLSYMLWLSAILAMSSLGAITRMFLDHAKEEKRITRAAWATNVTSGACAGLIIAFFTWDSYGFSPLHLTFCGAAGFGSVQVLGLVALGLTLMVRRALGLSPKEDEK